MKRIMLTCLTILSCGAAYALPVGNPTEASLMCDGVFCEGCCGNPCCDPCFSWCDAWSLRVGFYGDYIFNRHFEIDHRPHTSDIEDTEIFTNAGYLALNFCNRVDLFATLGATSVRLQSPASSFVPLIGSRLFILQTDTDFSWSLGVRGTLWQCGCFGVGLEGQYFRTCPHINYIRLEAGEPIYLDDRFDFQYREWQAGLGASYRINIASCATALVPYVAVKWNDAKVDLHPNDPINLFPSFAVLRDLAAKKHWGFAVGATLLGCDKAAVTVEGRFADEKAVSVNGQFRF